MKKPTMHTLIIGAIVVAGIAALSILRSGEEPAVVLAPNDAALVALGETVYAQHCASCHGANREGEPNWWVRGDDGRIPAPPHNDTGHTWHHPDDYLFNMTKYGLGQLRGSEYLSDMPAYADILSDREILAVLSFLKSRWPAEIRRRHDAINRRAAKSR